VLLLVIPLSIDGSVFADDDDGTGETKAENFNDSIRNYSFLTKEMKHNGNFDRR